CNRQRDKIKILRWDHNGFWLYYRRLERGKFQWPPKTGDRMPSSIHHHPFYPRPAAPASRPAPQTLHRRPLRVCHWQLAASVYYSRHAPCRMGFAHHFPFPVSPSVLSPSLRVLGGSPLLTSTAPNFPRTKILRRRIIPSGLSARLHSFGGGSLKTEYLLLSTKRTHLSSSRHLPRHVPFQNEPISPWQLPTTNWQLLSTKRTHSPTIHYPLSTNPLRITPPWSPVCSQWSPEGSRKVPRGPLAAPAQVRREPLPRQEAIRDPLQPTALPCGILEILKWLPTLQLD
ncbi:MAG: IS66 family insertion sequence element accessory protein TnpB, partial [Bacillota bacterium]